MKIIKNGCWKTVVKKLNFNEKIKRKREEDENKSKLQ